MKKNILLATILLFLAVSCHPKKADNNNTAAQLKSLKAQRDKLNIEIHKLEAKSPSDSSATVVNVSVEKVHPSVFKHYLEVQGKVESNSNIFLTPRVPGAIVTVVNVARGDKVHKGEVLARLDAGVLQQSVTELQGQLDLAKTIYERRKNLWEQKIGSEIQYLTAKNNYESMKSRMASLQQQLDMYTLTSPINGTVDDVSLKAGEIPIPGKEGIRVVNPNDVKITAEISEAYIAKVAKGNNVKVYLPDLGKEYDAKIKTVSRVIDPTNRTFLIEIDPKGLRNELRPNMIAVIKINDYTNPKAIVLPLNVVQSDENGHFVYVAIPTAKGGYVAHRKTVETGESYGNNIEIISGLGPDDQVITTGYQSVVEGQKIAISD